MSKGVRVLYLSYDGLFEPLGESQILSYVRLLAEKGVRYNLVTLEKRELFSDRGKTLRLKNKLAGLGIEWQPLAYNSSRGALSGIGNFMRFFLASLKTAVNAKVNFVHARSYLPCACAIVLKKLLKVKVIFDMRGFWADERVEAGLWKQNSFVLKAAKRAEKVLLRASDEVISLTIKAAEEINSAGFAALPSNRITVIPTCVDLERFFPEAKTAGGLEFTLVYSGSLSTWAMPSEMLRFFAALKIHMAAARFLVLTREDKLFKSLLNSEKVNAEGISVFSSAFEGMRGYLSAANAGVAFYKPGLSRKARCPTKVAEYLACGLPVVINSGIGDTDEIVQKEKVGVIVRDFSREAYGRAIGELEALFSDSKALAVRCRQAAKKYFSLYDGANRYMEVYGRLSALSGK